MKKDKLGMQAPETSSEIQMKAGYEAALSPPGGALDIGDSLLVIGYSKGRGGGEKSK